MPDASNTGQRLDELVQFADTLQSEIDALNEQLDHKKSIQVKVLQTDLPNLLHELGLNEVTRGDLKVALTDGITISIPGDDQTGAYP